MVDDTIADNKEELCVTQLLFRGLPVGYSTSLHAFDVNARTVSNMPAPDADHLLSPFFPQDKATRILIWDLLLKNNRNLFNNGDLYSTRLIRKVDLTIFNLSRLKSLANFIKQPEAKPLILLNEDVKNKWVIFYRYVFYI